MFGQSTLNGGAGNDDLEGQDGQFTLNGEAGDDVLSSGFNAIATLNGGAGNDKLFVTDKGTYQLLGGAGNDVLHVFAGFDADYTLSGGAGADLFKYSVDDADLGNVEKNIITDFAGAGAGIGDRIDLTTIDANDTLTGNQAFTYIGSNPFTFVSSLGFFHVPGQLRYSGGVLQGNTDFDGAAEFEIQLIGAPALVVGGAGTDILL